MKQSSKDYKQKLHSLQQEHLLENPPSDSLLKQIECLDPEVFHQQQRLVKETVAHSFKLTPPPIFTPVETISVPNSKVFGQAGCLVVAGGQGTRLGFKSAKGLFPVGAKTLYQITAERILKASQKAHRFLPLAIMTSPDNHEETQGYFQRHNFFGLCPEHVDFFSQTELPFLDDAGKLFLDPHGELAMGPDGNGWALKHFYLSGIWEKWFEKGVRALNFTLIDNLLADPFDAPLIQFHMENDSDITVKGILREDPLEKVGIFAEQNGHLSVVEYTEFPAEERQRRGTNGVLSYPYANISLFCFKMEAISNWDYAQMPWHLAHKPAQRHDLSSPPAWKFEKFIFDLLPLTKKVKGVLYPRASCFAPLKNPADLPHAQAALQSLILDDRI